MPGGVLPIQYVEENGSTGMTAMAGLGVCLALRESVERHVGVRRGTQGWTDRW